MEENLERKRGKYETKGGREAVLSEFIFKNKTSI